MSVLLLTKFNFRRDKSRIEIPAESVNLLIANEIRDNASIYQRLFNVYSYMKLNSNQKYVIHTMSGVPFVWQTHNNCGWDPTGALFYGRTEIEPCKAKINEEFCVDELFDGCFKHLLVWKGTGNHPELSDAGAQVFNEMVKQLAMNATIGARLTLTVGQLFKTDAIVFNENTPAEIRTMFNKTMGTCKGWIELLRATAASDAARYGHFNLTSLMPTGSFTGTAFTASAVTLYDSLVANAKPELSQAINEGGMALVDGSSPLFLVTPSIYNKIIAELRTQNAQVAQNNPRITKESMSVGGRSVSIYKIDETPVVPLSEVGYADKYLTGVLHLAAVCVSGVIAMGATFGELPGFEGQGVGLAIQKETDLREMGKYYFSSYSLFATAIADSNYIVAAQRYTVGS